MNDFERFCDTQEHAQEIAKSRVGCLGSSDAKMVLKVALKGIQALSNTDIKRLRVMLGLEPFADFGGSAATNAGHLFEDYIEQNFRLLEYPYEREKRLSADKIHFDNFVVIAHADFAAPMKNGIGTEYLITECKYVQKETSKVWVDYQAQLQWYYLFRHTFGVQLCHGRGSVEPFEVSNVEYIDIPRDDKMIELLKSGLVAIDNWCNEQLGKQHETNLEGTNLDEFLAEYDSELSSMLCKYYALKSVIDLHMQDLETTKAEILEYMEKNGIQSGENTLAKVTYKAASVQRRLDTTKVQSKYPQIVTDEECWKNTNIKSSITIKIKEQ